MRRSAADFRNARLIELYRQGRSAAQIAARLGMSPNQVSAVLSRRGLTNRQARRAGFEPGLCAEGGCVKRGYVAGLGE